MQESSMTFQWESSVTFQLIKTNVRTAVRTAEINKINVCTGKFAGRTERIANVTRGHKGAHKIFSTANEVANKEKCSKGTPETAGTNLPAGMEPLAPKPAGTEQLAPKPCGRMNETNERNK